MWASKPAEITRRSGLEVAQPRQDHGLEGFAELVAAVAGAQRRVDDGVEHRRARRSRRCRDRAASRGSSSTARSGRPRRCPACRCRDARRNRRWRRARRRTSSAHARGDRRVVEQAEAHRPRRLGVVAGRPHRRRRRSRSGPSSPRRPPARAPPTARSAASNVPGDIEVSASIRTMPFRRGVADRLDIFHRMASEMMSASAIGACSRASVWNRSASSACSMARRRSGRSGCPAGVRWSRQAGWEMRSVDIGVLTPFHGRHCLTRRPRQWARPGRLRLFQRLKLTPSGGGMCPERRNRPAAAGSD